MNKQIHLNYKDIYNKEQDILKYSNNLNNFIVSSKLYWVNGEYHIHDVPLNRQNINTNIYPNRIELELNGYFMIANIKIPDYNYKNVLIKSENNRFKLLGKKKDNIWTIPFIDNNEFLFLHLHNFPLYLVIYTNVIYFNNLNISYDVKLIEVKDAVEFCQNYIEKKYYISYEQTLYNNNLSSFNRFKDLCYFYL